LVVLRTLLHAATAATDGVDLVDEDDRRGVLLRLAEQLTHPRCAHADIQLDELRAADREEGGPRLARQRTGQERLPGAGRSGEQDAARDTGTEPAESLRIAEVIDDVRDLFLDLLRAGHVVEGNDPLTRPDGLEAAAPCRRGADAAGPEPAEQHEDHHTHGDDGQDAQQEHEIGGDGAVPGRVDVRPALHRDPCIREERRQGLTCWKRHAGLALVGVGNLGRLAVVGEMDLRDATVADVRQNLSEVHRLWRGAHTDAHADENEHCQRQGAKCQPPSIFVHAYLSLRLPASAWRKWSGVAVEFAPAPFWRNPAQSLPTAVRPP